MLAGAIRRRLSYTLTIPSPTLTDPKTTGPSTVGVQFNSDGTTTYFGDDTPGGFSGPNWIEPPSAATAFTFYIRYTNLSVSSGSGFNLESAASEDTWIQLNANRAWKAWDPISTAAGRQNFTNDFEIGTDGSTAEDSGSCSFDADYEV